jgi:imidazolonepropionase-like amidohydrolase
VERGVDWIKVMATGGLMTRGARAHAAQFSGEDLAHAVRESARRGLPVAAHCHGTQGIRRAAEAGVRTIEHCSFAGKQGFGSDPDPDSFRAIASRARDPATPIWVSPTVNAGWARLLRRDGKPTPFGRRMASVMHQLAETGAGFVASTDAGIPGVEHHHLPRALLVFASLAGFTPLQVLRAVTSEAASALGLERDTGALEPGLAADILVVDGNPLKDLSSLLRPRLVVARGEIVADLGDQGAAG